MSQILVTRFLELILKRCQKNFWHSVQKTGQEGKKEKKTRMAIAKLFALNTTAIKLTKAKYM